MDIRNSSIATSPRRIDELRGELEVFRRYKELEIEIPPMAGIENRMAQLQELLERRTEKSAQLLREILGSVRLEPTVWAKGRTHYRQHRSSRSCRSGTSEFRPRTRVRSLCSGGGGGSRTRVRRRGTESHSMLSPS